MVALRPHSASSGHGRHNEDELYGVGRKYFSSQMLQLSAPMAPRPLLVLEAHFLHGESCVSWKDPARQPHRPLPS
eukprot:5937473-Prymnesium_polylepis.1